MPSALPCLALPSNPPGQPGSPLASEPLTPLQVLAEINERVQRLLGAQLEAENEGKCFGSHFQSSEDLEKSSATELVARSQGAPVLCCSAPRWPSLRSRYCLCRSVTLGRYFCRCDQVSLPTRRRPRQQPGGAGDGGSRPGRRCAAAAGAVRWSGPAAAPAPRAGAYSERPAGQRAGRGGRPRLGGGQPRRGAGTAPSIPGGWREAAVGGTRGTRQISRMFAEKGKNPFAFVRSGWSALTAPGAAAGTGGCRGARAATGGRGRRGCCRPRDGDRRRSRHRQRSCPCLGGGRGHGGGRGGWRAEPLCHTSRHAANCHLGEFPERPCSRCPLVTYSARESIRAECHWRGESVLV